MSMPRKNKGGEGNRDRKEYAAWFWDSVKRNRKRKKLAKIARRKNR